MTKVRNTPSDCHPERPNHGHGLCEACYWKQRYQRDKDKIKERQRVYRINNLEKVKAQDKKFRDNAIATKPDWYAKNKRKTRNNRLKREFGISLEEYEQILAKQGGMCAICKRIGHQKRDLSVDHDHSTGKIRELLCGACNTALGCLGDNIDFFMSAIEYLKKHK